jgi:predicted dehydrogenase
MHEHMRRLEGVKKAEVVALAEPNDASLARIIEHYPSLSVVPAFTDHRDMLASADLDGAIISTPHSLHFEQITDCLKAGIHVLCEKPMVCNVSQARQAVRMAEKLGLTLMVSYQRHTTPIFQQARKLIAEGKIGRLTFVTALLAQEWLVGCKGTWRQDPKLSCGGQLNDSGSHMLDMLLWVTGLAATSVYANIDNRGVKVDINSSLTIKLTGGVLGNIAVIGDAPGWYEEVTFYGEAGALYIRNYRLYHHTPCKPGTWGDPKVTDLTDKLKGGSDPDANFVGVILGKEEPQSPGSCGLRVAELTQAAWESARTGKPVKLR